MSEILHLSFILEIAAFILGIFGVYLSIHMNRYNYLLHCIAAILIIYLLISKETYAMAFVRVIIVGLCLKGFIEWRKSPKLEAYIDRSVGFYAIAYAVFTFICVSLFYFFASYNDNIRLILDSVGAATAMFALYLQVKKNLYTWYFWLWSDVVGIALMIYIKLPFLALQYFIFLYLCFKAYQSWKLHVIKR